METDDGPVEIEAEAIERVEHAAEKHVIRPEEELPSAGNGKTGEERPPIDRPNTRPFLEKLFLRDGKRCSNPFCRRRLDHQGHHITERSEGGRTELHNEIGVCRFCHALITVGLLEVAGNPIDGLTFTPKAAKLSPGLSREKAELDEMPIVTVSLPEPSGYPDAPDEAQAYEDAVLGLETLGWKKKEAPLRATRALGS